MEPRKRCCDNEDWPEQQRHEREGECERVLRKGKDFFMESVWSQVHIGAGSKATGNDINPPIAYVLRATSTKPLPEVSSRAQTHKNSPIESLFSHRWMMGSHFTLMNPRYRRSSPYSSFLSSHKANKWDR